MTTNNPEVCDAFKIGTWKINSPNRCVTIDDRVASMLGARSTEYSFDSITSRVDEPCSLQKFLTSPANGEFKFRLTIKGEPHTAHVITTSIDGTRSGFVRFEKHARANEFELLRTIHDNIPIGLELFDHNGQHLEINAQAMALFGIDGNCDLKNTCLFDDPGLPDWFRVRLREGKAVDTTIIYDFDKAGKYYNSKYKGTVKISCKSTPIVDSNGKTTNFLVTYSDDADSMRIDNIMEDITERRKAEKKFNELNELNLLMSSILEHVPVALFVKDPNKESKYLYWNKAVAELTAIPPEKAIGYKDKDIFPSQINARKFLEDDARLLEHSERIEFEENLLDANGTTRYLHTVKTLIPTGEQLPWILGVSWDITELKNIQFDLTQAKEKAEESDRFKSSFIANMSHEIRTPLNAIVGFSELVSDPDTEQSDKEEYLEIIHKNNQLLLQLISDILDMSRIDAHMLELHHERLSLNLLCNRVATLCSKRHDVKVPIIFDKDNTPEYIVVSDENRIQQILTNFVTNSIKFTSKGEIEIGIKPLNDTEIEVYVRDTGTGIRAEKLKSVFDRFVKLDSYVQGTGLGLSISKNLAEKLGGRIGVESEFGTGSQFWFTLPYSQNI